MSDAKHIADSLAHALPDTADPRDELIALLLVTSGVILTTEPDERAELVDNFCRVLRESVILDLN